MFFSCIKEKLGLEARALDDVHVCPIPLPTFWGYTEALEWGN